MPKIRIDILEGKPEAYKKELLDIVHDALVEAIRIPDWDRVQILQEHKPENFEIPPGKTDKYTSIEILMFPGRSLEAKRRIYELITKKLKSALGIDETDVSIILIEPPMENWGVLGRPASEIDVGFKIDV
jgi:4-oxalocrotonate tautomerase family enzyme